VSFRIFPDHVEVDVLKSSAPVGTPAGLDALASLLRRQGRVPSEIQGATENGESRDGVIAVDDPETFAVWMAGVLRREGMTMEAAARQPGVSVKTVSRWVGGATEPPPSRDCETCGGYASCSARPRSPETGRNARSTLSSPETGHASYLALAPEASVVSYP
jgi:hypothetical protein